MKTSRGRQKIPIKKIEKKSSLQVTFSKRRAGLFKKAGEFALLTGCEIAILVRSPGNGLFCFGSPSVDTVIDRWFLANNTTSADGDGDGYVASPLPSSTSATSSERKDKFWWEDPVPEDMGLEELEEYVAALEELKKNVSRKLSAKEGIPASVVNGWLDWTQDQSLSCDSSTCSFLGHDDHQTWADTTGGLGVAMAPTKKI